MQNQLKDLIREIDYQSEYSYDQRVDLFNKYHLSVSTKYINPIMLLVDHLSSPDKSYGKWNQFNFYGVSHSGAVATAFNKEFVENTSNYVKITNVNTAFNVFRVFEYNRDIKDFEMIMLFKEDKTSGEVKFKFNKFKDFWPKKGYCFYEAAEEFCKDFGFNIKF